jgi:HKD family nuclease
MANRWPQYIHSSFQRGWALFITNVSKRKSHLSVVKEILSENDEIVLCSGWMKMCGLSELLPLIDEALARNAKVSIYTNAEHTQASCVAALSQRLSVTHSNVKNPYLHTKLYYGRTRDSFIAMTGSANVTAGGLWRNEEFSQLSYGGIGDPTHAPLEAYLKKLSRLGIA